MSQSAGLYLVDEIMLVAIDEPVSEPLLWKICNLDGVKNVKSLNF